jgi:hypothetical protein
MTLLCIRYIMTAAENEPYLLETTKETCTPESIRDPFLVYAVETLFVHARLSGPEIKREVYWFQLYISNTNYHQAFVKLSGYLNGELIQSPHIIHYLAAYGVTNLLEYIDFVNASNRNRLDVSLETFWHHTKGKLRDLLSSSKSTPILLIREPIDATNHHGDTILHFAAFGNSHGYLKLRRTHSSEVDIRNEFGQTPLHIASQ